MKVAEVRSPGGLENLIITERDEPTLEAGELLVRVMANSLNFHDYLVASGAISLRDSRILMSDGAGEILAVGEGVTEYKVGDRVISLFFPAWLGGEPNVKSLTGVPGDQEDGFAAEIVAMPASAFTLAPSNLSYEEAATLPCAALTAWRALMVEAKIKPGEWILTQGTGGVSIFALQFAKMAGAKVIATSSSEEKLIRLRELGADEVINYKSDDKWGVTAKKLTGGRGVDSVVEVGGVGTLAQSIDACRVGGHISLIGVLTGVSGEVPTRKLFSRNLTIKGLSVGSRQVQEDMVRAIEANNIKPVISHRFTLEGLKTAFELQKEQQHFGKIVVTL